jgi:hypothetical protein
MEVLALPGLIPNFELKQFEAAFEGFRFSTVATCPISPLC